MHCCAKNADGVKIVWPRAPGVSPTSSSPLGESSRRRVLQARGCRKGLQPTCFTTVWSLSTRGDKSTGVGDDLMYACFAKLCVHTNKNKDPKSQVQADTLLGAIVKPIQPKPETRVVLRRERSCSHLFAIHTRRGDISASGCQSISFCTCDSRPGRQCHLWKGLCNWILFSNGWKKD